MGKKLEKRLGALLDALTVTATTPGDDEVPPGTRWGPPKALIVQMDIRGMSSVRMFVHSMMEFRKELEQAGHDEFADKLGRQLMRFQLDDPSRLVRVQELQEESS